jgi:hypothetical protein
MTNHLLCSAGRVRTEPPTAADGGPAVLHGSVVGLQVCGSSAPAAEREALSRLRRLNEARQSALPVLSCGRCSHRLYWLWRSFGRHLEFLDRCGRFPRWLFEQGVQNLTGAEEQGGERDSARRRTD